MRRRKKSIGKVLGLGLIVAAPLVSAQAQSQNFEPAFSKDRPLLETDLREYGYKPGLSGRSDFLSLDFTDSKHLIFGWTTLDDPDVDRKKGLLTLVPSHLHAVLLDAHTGQKQTVREWPTPTFYAGVDAVQDGHLVICTGNEIRLLSRDFEVIREDELPSSSQCFGHEFSPSKRTLTIRSGPVLDYQNSLLDVKTFSPLSSWTKEVRTVHFTDSLLVGTCSPDFAVCIRTFDQPWGPFHFDGMDQQMKDYRNKFAFFINDSTLGIIALREMAVVTVDGKLLFRVNLPNKWSFGKPVMSRGGERFALIENKLRGLRNEGLDMYPFPSNDHAVVYSLPDRRAIYTLKVNGTSPWAPWVMHKNQMALSPDGALLAIVDDGILKVYQLPASKS